MIDFVWRRLINRMTVGLGLVKSKRGMLAIALCPLTGQYRQKLRRPLILSTMAMPPMNCVPEEDNEKLHSIPSALSVPSMHSVLYLFDYKLDTVTLSFTF
jgi:hypothetical protein